MWSYTQPAEACSKTVQRHRLSAVHQRAQLRPRHAADGGLPRGARASDGRAITKGKSDGSIPGYRGRDSGFVALVEIRRPPNNFFDIALIREIAGALEALDQDQMPGGGAGLARQSVLRGRQFRRRQRAGPRGTTAGRAGADGGHLYIEAVRLFRIGSRSSAAVHGAAVGGGLGLALVADFRVTCPEARFCANFTRLGFHPGFGLTTTLPEAIGTTNAALMFYTSRRVTGEEAHRMGLASVLVAQDRGARGGAKARRRDRRERAARRRGDARDPAGGPRRARQRRPTTSSPSRAACARPTIFAKASRPWPSAACRISPDGRSPPQG